MENPDIAGTGVIMSGSYVGAISIEYVHEVNYAIVHNHVPILSYIEICNDSGIDWNDISVEISGEHIMTSSASVAFLEAWAMTQIRKISISPDPILLLKILKRSVPRSH